MPETAKTVADPTRQENVTRILDCAERLFRHYGYGKTNVADIARELGMSPANIYRFFASKVEIHQAVCGRMLAAELPAGLRDFPLADAAPRSGCAAMCRRIIELTMRHHARRREGARDGHRRLERDWHVIEKHIDRIHDLLAEVIREGIAPASLPTVTRNRFALLRRRHRHPLPSADGGAVPCQDNRAMPDELIEFRASGP